MPDARDIRIIHVSLQGIPPGKGLLTTSNHQLTLKHICSSLDLFLLGHTLFYALTVQISPIHPDTTASPLFWLPPAVVSHDMALEVGNTVVLLDVLASDDGTLEVGLLVNPLGTIFTLEVTRGDGTLVRVRTPVSAGGSDTLLGFGGGRTSGREGRATGRLALGGDLTLLLLLGGGCPCRTVLVVVIGGRNVVGIAFTIQFRAIGAGGRGGWAGRGKGRNAPVSRS